MSAARKFAHSFQVQLTLVAALGAVILAGLLGFHGLQILNETTGRLFNERLVTAQALADRLDDALGGTLQRLAAVGRSGVAAEGGDPLEAAGRLLHEVAPLLPVASYGLYLIDPQGRVRQAERGRAEPSSPAAEGAGRPAAGAVAAVRAAEVELTHVEAVRETLAAGRPTASGLELIGPDRVPVVLLCAPVAGRGGAVAGAVCAAADLRRSHLLEYIKGAAIGSTGHAVVVDRRGMVLAATDPGDRFRADEHPDFHPPLVAARRAAVGRTAYYRGERVVAQHVMAFAPLRTAPWGVSFGQTEAEAFEPVARLRTRMLLAGVTALLLALLLARWAAGAVARPVLGLARAASRMAAGDLQTPISVAGPGELRDLGAALETMRAHLAALMGESARREREAQTLYQVSRDILAITDAHTTLEAVAARARALLNADVAAVCLRESGGSRLFPGAVSGPEDALLARGAAEGLPCENLTGRVPWTAVPACPFLHSRYRRVHVMAPLVVGEEGVGALCVGCARARPLPGEDAGLLSSLANLAALAIHSAQLRDQVRHLAVLQERERIGQDLHDSLNQSLYGVSLALESVLARLGDDPQEARRGLNAAIDTLTAAIREIRRFTHGLQPSEEGDSLIAGLVHVVGEFEGHTRIPVTLSVEGDRVEVPRGHSAQLLLIVREALANVARHAQAPAALVHLRVAEGILHLAVRDEGRGFDMATLDRRGGLGLKSIAARAHRLGAEAVVASTPGRGTRVEVRVPLPVLGGGEAWAARAS